jgi:nucleotide-binding universal stress UspA family protein
MSYRTVMLHLDLNSDNRGVLAVGNEIVRRHDADVIGIAAAQPLPPMPDGAYYSGVSMTAEMVQLDREQTMRDMAVCEKQFRQSLSGCKGQVEWRAVITPDPLPAWIAEQARAADLIVTSPARPFSILDSHTRVNVGALALRAGRPVLVVPPKLEALALREVLVLWKDTREVRRAICDALPLLLEAEKVTVLSVADADELQSVQTRVDDVARWLGRHGVHAVARAFAADTHADIVLAEQVAAAAPDLLVAGAYGHSRLNEWAFGGVTRDILLRASHCVLLSH